jgi:opacity protein-like surface antigen
MIIHNIMQGRTMKIVRAIIFSLFLYPCVSYAQFFKDGIHLAYPVGGDVRDEQAGFGLHVTYEWTEFMSLEASLGRQTDSITDWDVVSAPFQNDFDLEVVYAALSGRLGYRLGNFHPYAGAGFGYYSMRADGKNTNRSIRENAAALPEGLLGLQVGADPDNAFAYHVALGVEWIIVPRVELFAEYRYTFLETDVSFTRTETTLAPESERTDLFKTTTSRSEPFDYNHGLVRVGASLRF